MGSLIVATRTDECENVSSCDAGEEGREEEQDDAGRQPELAVGVREFCRKFSGEDPGRLFVGRQRSGRSGLCQGGVVTCEGGGEDEVCSCQEEECGTSFGGWGGGEEERC